MRISGIYNNYRTYGTATRQKQPSFRGEECEKAYSPYVIAMAKKYIYVKNNPDLIWNEVDNNNDDYDYDTYDKYNEIIALIEKLKIAYASKDKKIQTLDTNINRINKENELELAKHIKLSREIDKENDSRDSERVQINKLLVKERRKKHICQELNSKYIKLNELEEKSYPHGIMILGLDDKDAQKDVINYLKDNGCKILQIDFNKIPLRAVNKEFLTHLKKIKQSGEHSIIYIENFDKYTLPTEENFNIISKLKSTLCTCADEYNTTVLVFESHPERLDENIIGGHRFKKKIDARNIKGEEFIAFVPKYDGYTMHFGADENDQVDLYLGSFGHNFNKLWIDTSSPEKIKKVLENIDKIKSKELFKHIEYAEMPEPDDINAIPDIIPLERKTKDFKTIYGIELVNR